MATTTPFHLDHAIQLWREHLATSPQFQADEVAELESHLRDSVIALQSQGLSPEESFIIASRRVGSVEQIEPEFRKVNRRFKTLIPFLLILMLLSASCFLLWATLQLPRMVGPRGGIPFPGFTVMAMKWKNLLVLPPFFAVVYCGYVALKPTGKRPGWTGFFATSVGLVILLTLPVLVAVILPLIDRMNQLGLPH